MLETRRVRVGSFGERMRREREMRKVALDEIAAATKIGTRSLKALEDEEFGKLPGGIFNKGFVRAYARFLGINEEQAVADYLAAAGEIEEKAPEIDIAQIVAQQETDKYSAKVRSRNLGSINSKAGFPWLSVAALVLVVAAASGGWKLYQMHKGRVEAKAQEAAMRDSAMPQMAKSGGVANVAVSNVTQQGPAPAAPQAPLATASGENFAPEIAASDAVSNAAGSVTGDGFVVSVRATGDAWISIIADGKPVVSRLMHPSNETSVHAKDKVIFKTGNAGAVEIAFNGKVLDPIGRNSEVRTIVITSDGTVQ